MAGRIVKGMMRQAAKKLARKAAAAPAGPVREDLAGQVVGTGAPVAKRRRGGGGIMAGRRRKY